MKLAQSPITFTKQHPNPSPSPKLKNFIILPKMTNIKDHHKNRLKQIYQFALKGSSRGESEKIQLGKGREQRVGGVRASPMRLGRVEKEELGRVELVRRGKMGEEGEGQLKPESKDGLGKIRTRRSVSSTRGKTLPSILPRQCKEFEWEQIHNQFFPRSKILRNHLSPLVQEADEQKSVISQQQQHRKIKPPSRIAKHHQKISSETERVHSGSKLKQIFIKTTCFQEYFKEEENFRMKNDETPRTVTSLSCSFDQLSKQDVESFILSYKPLDFEFDIRKIAKSELFGTITFKNGIYFGEVVGKKRHGLGVFMTAKYLFEGSFLNGYKHHGSERNSEGVYTGSMSNGLREGEGTFRWNNGEIYKGEWREGKKHGKGVWKGLENDSYEGDWKDNRQEGYGTHKHPKSNYQGQFQNFLKHGQGTEIFDNGDIYVGHYYQGKPNGWGVYTWKNGDKYEGTFVDGCRHGEGTMIESGVCCKGYFNMDVKMEGKKPTEQYFNFEKN